MLEHPLFCIHWGATFIGGIYGGDALNDSYDTSKQQRSTSWDTLKSQLVDAAEEAGDVQGLLWLTQYWTPSIHQKWGQFIDKNLEAQSALNSLKDSGNDCNDNVMYIYDKSDEWFHELIWVGANE